MRRPSSRRRDVCEVRPPGPPTRSRRKADLSPRSTRAPKSTVRRDGCEISAATARRGRPAHQRCAEPRLHQQGLSWDGRADSDGSARPRSLQYRRQLRPLVQDGATKAVVVGVEGAAMDVAGAMGSAAAATAAAAAGRAVASLEGWVEARAAATVAPSAEAVTELEATPLQTQRRSKRGT